MTQLSMLERLFLCRYRVDDRHHFLIGMVQCDTSNYLYIFESFTIQFYENRGNGVMARPRRRHTAPPERHLILFC